MTSISFTSATDLKELTLRPKEPLPIRGGQRRCNPPLVEQTRPPPRPQIISLYVLLLVRAHELSIPHNGIMLITSGCANGRWRAHNYSDCVWWRALISRQALCRSAARPTVQPMSHWAIGIAMSWVEFAGADDLACQQLNYLHVPQSHFISLPPTGWDV